LSESFSFPERFNVFEILTKHLLGITLFNNELRTFVLFWFRLSTPYLGYIVVPFVQTTAGPIP